ncbi:hypothetical protein [Spirosoma sordidisoli]|uniref:Uncharacterized protein n=1 Tax=Spirosoma sordidisoli TaxID=2502893 RepID=A0A4Q2UDP3_9BACT|nr:hypothetical protein [Spirosoma sordidisoli]RYC66352.1 hypothetical protein EQG79_30225 [Spirosoma sordidisoli]
MTTQLLSSLGLVADPNTGQITGIDLAISPGPLLSAGYGRRVRLLQLTLSSTLEMTAIFERYIVDADGNDAHRQVQNDASLHPTAQRERLTVLQPLQIPKTTAGAYRSKTTGQVCAPVDADGEPNPDAVPELAFFQTLALAQLQEQGLPLTGAEGYLVVLYLMLANIIREKDELGEF